ncbi:DNA methyltransferase [Camelimonas fluminis]|uniref:site-specific DNA-methyltransferase (adenine-specific) n=1 Tax=Camelimonas fluminis TaxID=1576911 RepID=A0ABV7UI53_9HYPH
MTTLKGQTVYDPMAGSNTTGQVALEMDRRFIASEADARVSERFRIPI